MNSVIPSIRSPTGTRFPLCALSGENCCSTGGELGLFIERDQRSIFLSFEFRKFVSFWVLAIVAVFFGVPNK